MQHHPAGQLDKWVISLLMSVPLRTHRNAEAEPCFAPCLSLLKCYTILFAVKPTVTQITDQLILSYARAGGINHIDGKNLPSKTTIASITHDLLRLVFPGFFDERIIHSSELKVEMVSLVDSVSGRLEDEVSKALDYSTPEGVAKQERRNLAKDL